MAKKTELLNLQFILGKMKEGITHGRLYSYFRGVDDVMSVEELKDMKEVVKKEANNFFSKVDKSIKRIEKEQVGG